ncbi:protein deadpan [Ooceraea biroi]|uniref:Protein deadpan n=1 Tax=Ooceraea biroi TaxID=2015173 RepID=A0A026VWT9_OOCBI|nr:protein deadpan [Ooceraea biroi]EZA48258.1 Protein deadpan [Ooceraea biroi]
MLGSEEEPERRAQSGMSKAEQRKSNKPIMEKRRRARINQYLDELKNFILVNEKDPTRHSKLEKADILEMTVKRIQTMQQQQLNVAIAGDPGVLTKFRSGFSECATEVSRFVNSLENVDPAVKQRLVSHLNKCVSHLQQMAPFCSYYVPYMPERLYPEVKVGFQSDLQNGDENNNGSARIQIPNGVHLIPSRLPTGELALLVPQSAGIPTNFSFFPPGTESSTRIGQSSAFTAVHKSRNSPCSPAGSSSSCDDESHHLEHPQATSSPNPHQPHSSQGKLNEPVLPVPSPASSKSLTSSPETQKRQISSSSDRKSPAPGFPESKPIGSADQIAKKESQAANYARKFTEEFMNSVRQPLSVITDRTSNRSWSPVQPKAIVSPMKREVDGLLVISDKRPRYQEPTSSTSSMNNDDALESANEQSISIDDPAARQMSPLLRNALSFNIFQRNQAEVPFNSNMWRPW